jgi:short-subunit dehydrogenase
MARIISSLAGGALVAGAALAGARARPPVDLRGAVVLITGGSRGLGYALAQRFARERARIVLCARDAEHVAGAARELRRDGAEVLASRCNVADGREVEELVAKTSEAFGPVDVLVNNAGVLTVGPVHHQRLEDFQEAMDVMFWGVVRPTLAVLPAMLERRRGHIATITSIGGIVSAPHLVPYACAKSAAIGFTEGIAAELAADGIVVTNVVPGLMRTGSHRNVVVKGRQDAEYRWLALAAANALTTTAPERAAERVVQAVRHRRKHVFIGLDSRVAARVHALAPGATVGALGWVARALPRPGGSGAQRSIGKLHESDLTSGAATAPGREAARRLRQEAGA